MRDKNKKRPANRPTYPKMPWKDMWSDRAMISDRELYEKSESIPLSLEDFIGFVQHRIVNANEACQLLGCSRQNIDDLMKRDKLHPIRKDAKYKLFLKSEIMQRRKQ